MRRDFYVYFHKDRSDRIFYIGKGTGRRAWSTRRHVLWKKYVTERLNGKYYVEIHREGLTESEAEELECSLINKYGYHLVNWVNFGREFDYEGLDRFHKLRNKNLRWVDETRPFEKTDLPQAVARYRKALISMREYEAIETERGLVAEMGGSRPWGDWIILDRLTLCLIKLGRIREAIDEAEKYFADFPSLLELAAGKRIQARIEKQRKKVAML